VRLRTFVPILGTDWCERWQSGDLTLLDAHQALRETRLLIEKLEGPTTVLSDHISNFLNIHGRIPKERGLMLEAIDDALDLPLTAFRPPTERFVGMML
jgi:hypothetical protein